MKTRLYEKDIRELIKERFPNSKITFELYGDNGDSNFFIEVEEEIKDKKLIEVKNIK